MGAWSVRLSLPHSIFTRYGGSGIQKFPLKGILSNSRIRSNPLFGCGRGRKDPRSHVAGQHANIQAGRHTYIHTQKRGRYQKNHPFVCVCWCVRVCVRARACTLPCAHVRTCTNRSASASTHASIRNTRAPCHWSRQGHMVCCSSCTCAPPRWHSRTHARKQLAAPLLDAKQRRGEKGTTATTAPTVSHAIGIGKRSLRISKSGGNTIDAPECSRRPTTSVCLHNSTLGISREEPFIITRMCAFLS